MRRLLIVLMATAGAIAFAQTDAPPELNDPLVPDDVPELDAPATSTSGKLQVEFIGASAFPESKLREGIALQIQSIEEFGLDDSGAYDAAFFLESFYRQSGYSQVVVTPEIQGAWNLKLTIQEGPVTTLGSVEIVGNSAYDTATLLEYLLGPLRERFPRVKLDTELPFVESDIYSGVGLVERLFASGGYLNAVIDGPMITMNADDTVANVRVTVAEGVEYRFGDVRFIGGEVFDREELLKLVAAHTSGSFTEGRLAAATRALEDFFVEHGYFQATVSASNNLGNATAGNVAVEFQISSGEIYRFDGISVEGTEGVKPAFIRKRMQRLSGKVYDPAMVDKTYRELIETGLFRNLRITPEAVDGDLVLLNVEVEEARPKEFGVGLGYASFYGGIVSASYRNLNLFGTGRPLNTEIEVNQRGVLGEVVYQDPWLFDTDYELLARLYGTTTTLKGYAKNEFGFRPTITRAITDAWEVSGFINAKHVAIRDVKIEPQSLVGLENYSVFSFGISQTLDTRNNPALPTRGFLFTTALELAPNGLGEVAYVRGVGNFSWYIPVTAKSTLALGARAGLMSALNADGIPIDERFFNGGATTVRSFSDLTLGPRDDAGYPLGGQGRTVFNIEYIFPIWGDFYGATFVDAGNVISEAANFGIENMRYAVGGGLRYNLPIGAVRFDYGLNPSPRPGEAQGAFHFAVGVAF